MNGDSVRRKIVIIECLSSCVNYISDIRDMGYEPVLVEHRVPDWRKESSRKYHDGNYALNGDILPEIIETSQDYEENLALMKSLDPVLILPGCDSAVELSTRLSAALGLVTNDPGNLSGTGGQFTFRATFSGSSH